MCIRIMKGDKVVDLTIVGGGFWGVALAVLAQEEGHDTVVVDDGRAEGASRNAAGIIVRGWYKQDTIKKMMPADWEGKEVDESIAWLEQFGLKKTGEVFSSFERTDPIFREDCFLLPSPASVLSVISPRTALVSAIRSRPYGWVIETEGGVNFASRKVFVTAGSATDDLLVASGFYPVTGVKPLLGRAVIARADGLGEVPHTYMSRPYTHWTARPWGKGLVRIGDTVERGMEREGAWRELNASPGRIGLAGYRPVKILRGLRPVCQEMRIVEVAPGFVAATGGHRVGLGIACLVARRALAILWPGNR